jgi:UDP-N-acetylglucosamine:LPS N-acetylglucosamine transferase
MRLVFIPVSGPLGRGEYSRSVSIAGEFSRRHPHAQIHFLVSREAPYAAEVPYPHTLLASSPTFHTAEVISILSQLAPDAVIFDNAGRTAQLRAARQLGAKVVYISARPRQRRKGFRLAWMRLLNEHWIAYPEVAAGSLGLIEKLKLQVLGQPVVRFLDPFLPGLGPPPARPGEYFLLVPGGGTGHPGATAAATVFFHAAQALARLNQPTVLILPRRLAVPETANLQRLDLQPTADLLALMQGARMVVSNGGATMLQALGCGAACVAAPIAQDQARRINRCAALGLVTHSRLDAQCLVDAVIGLLSDPQECAMQMARVRQLQFRDGLATAAGALESLLRAPR